MNNDKKKEVFDFVVKCSEDEKVMCDWFEIRDNLEIADEELSLAITELKKENKIKASVGEYLPTIESNVKKVNNEKRK